MFWWVAPLAVAGFGALFVVLGVGSVFQGEHGRAGRRVIGGTAAAGIGLVLSLLGLNTQLFTRLTHEGPVAEVRVKAIDPAQNRYLVTVHRLDGNIPDQSCLLQGDEWLISGRVQKWKAWANVLGLDATYSLDQLSNKYFTAERGNGRPITSAISPASRRRMPMCPRRGAAGSWRISTPRTAASVTPTTCRWPMARPTGSSSPSRASMPSQRTTRPRRRTTRGPDQGTFVAAGAASAVTMIDGGAPGTTAAASAWPSRVSRASSCSRIPAWRAASSFQPHTQNPPSMTKKIGARMNIDLSAAIASGALRVPSEGT